MPTGERAARTRNVRAKKWRSDRHQVTNAEPAHGVRRRSTAVATEVDRGTLLPVLAARSQATEDLTNRLFPATIPRMMSPSNGAGWAAGRIAADLAQLDVRRPIAG